MIPKHLMESKLITDEQWKEYQRLKHNWNELKEFAQEKLDNPSWASCGARYILDKMQELEKGSEE